MRDFVIDKDTFRIWAPRLIWAIVAVLVVGFFHKVSIWEHNYYESMEGSERAEATTTTTEPLDETEPTPEAVAEYTVAADKPRYLSIEKLGITNARVLEMGLKANNELRTPNNIFDVGWYFNSSKPGNGGTVLIDGHNGGPTKEGVFKHLDQLSEGDRIVLERGDGIKFIYEVVDYATVDLDAASEWMQKAQESPVAGQESLSLITCTGTWSQARQTYLQRQFVRAVLVAVE